MKCDNKHCKGIRIGRYLVVHPSLVSPRRAQNFRLLRLPQGQERVLPVSIGILSDLPGSVSLVPN